MASVRSNSRPSKDHVAELSTKLWELHPIVAPDRGPRDQKRGASLRTAAARSWNAVWDRLFQDYLDVVTSAAPRTAIV